MIHRPSNDLRTDDCFADMQEAIQLIGEYMRDLTLAQFVSDGIAAEQSRASGGPR